MRSKTSDELDKLLGLPGVSDQRWAAIDWILNPKNNVKVIIAFSGGKDSVALVLHALFTLKIPREQIELWHHDVDGDGEQLFDWPCTKSYCYAFAQAFGLKILFSGAKGGILREIYRTNETVQPVYYQDEMDSAYKTLLPKDEPRYYNTRRKFPAVSADLNTRWCSWIAKIGVMVKVINNIPRYKNCNMVVLTGERREESTNRSKYQEFEAYRGMSNTRRALTWRMIIDETESDVWEMFRIHKVQAHPCYELGWSRCSCQLCIFSDPDIWAALAELVPDKVRRISEIEDDLEFTLYSDKKNPIADIYTRVMKGTSFLEPVTRARWEKEAGGEFISPIIVDHWSLPKGAFSHAAAGSV